MRHTSVCRTLPRPVHSGMRLILGGKSQNVAVAGVMSPTESGWHHVNGRV